MAENKKLTWNPDPYTIECLRLNSVDSWKMFINSSSCFTRKKHVREYVYSKYDNKCANCGSDKNLTMDHILSVFECFHSKRYYSCNNISNIQLLCASCNGSKYIK